MGLRPEVEVLPGPRRGVERSLSITGVCERDIDLLVLEELHSSADFGRWLLKHVLPGKQADSWRVVKAGNSIDQPTGESDIEALFRSLSGRQLFLLFENKINACFQPLQQQRYRVRGQEYLRRKLCDDFRIVLLAPQSYLGKQGDTKGFDAAVTYEALRDWFTANGSTDRRTDYKICLLDLAIEKACFGYQLVEDAAVSEFWKCYWNFANECAPELEMAEPSPKPAGSGWAYFHPAGLPSTVRLVHKMPEGKVDLQFNRKAASIADLVRRFGPHLSPNMKILKATKSAVIRIQIPPLNIQAPFQEQAELARKGVAAAVELYFLWKKTGP